MTLLDKPFPMQADFKSLAMTGIGSAIGGNSIGESLGDVIVWLVQLTCHCVPPTGVIAAFHVLCTAIIVSLAFIVHYVVLKQKGE